MENKQYNFLELLEKVGIKIPIIQRDYAQGRDTDKSKSIRENFLENLLEKIKKKDNLNLDFVYGTIKNNCLIPLDGQQRLTTLFLLHYYLALQEKKLDDNLKNKLKKFTYETRISSREFCKLLIENNITSSDEKISQTIKNQTWFFSEWENDPTIKAMLIMLDSIQKKFKDCENCFDNLNKITFSFLDLEKFKLTDELYIKMNARGKPLSNFENFKSKFENYIDNSNLDDKERIKAKLDNEWLDIFWNLEKENLKNADEEKRKEILKSIEDKYFNFFKNITAFFSDNFSEVDIFKYSYTKSDINKIIKTLDCLVEYEKYKDTINEIKDNLNIFEDFIISNNDRNFTYEKRARFYALMLFFIHKSNLENNKNLFKSWMRVSLNLIHNTIFDKNNDFISILNLLNNLIKFLEKDFYCKLSTSNISKSEQFEEEKIKAKLISHNPKWEEEFIKAEKHWYLNGQIRFLLNYADNNFDKFIEYRDKFIKLWDLAKDKKNKSIKNKEILIHRALLTFGDYLPRHNKTDKYTFCTFGIGLREKNENWRRVFNQTIFKNFLDCIKTIDNLPLKLNEIINSYTFDCDDWKSYFINPNNSWTPISEAHYYQILWKNKYKVFLNDGWSSSGATGWGWSRVKELYTFYFFKKQIENIKFLPFKNNWYFESSSEYTCAVIDNYEDYAIDIYFDKGFEIYFYKKKNENLLKITNSYILEILKNNNFQENEDNQFKYQNKFTLCEMEELYKFLEKLTKEINENTFLPKRG